MPGTVDLHGMQTLRTTPRILFVAASMLLLVLLVPTAAQAAPPYQVQEEQFRKLINADRAEAGRGRLAAAPGAATVARNWSKRMAADGNLRHNPNVGEQLTIDWTRWGENVGWASNGGGASLSSVVKRLHKGFMESSGHRANIMGDFNQVGVGVAVDGRGTMWATMVFVDGPITSEPATGEPGSNPVGLTDISGSAHRKAITTAWREGLIKPCEGRRFCPKRQISRTEIANILGRMLELEPAKGNHFVDVANTSVVNALVDAGVVNGCAARRYCPTQRVTRAQLAALLVRGLPDLRPVAGERFADLPDGYVHAGAINALAAAGVTKGCAGDRFCPTEKVTREQLASLVVRARELR